MEMSTNNLVNELTSQLSNSDNYTNSLNTVNKNFFIILDDFNKYYIMYNKNPEVNEYQETFLNIKSQLQSTIYQLFTINNNIQTNINNINDKIQNINIEIQKEKIKNLDLKKSFKNVDNKNASSNIMIRNHKELYNNKYYYNVTLLVGIIIIIIIMFTYIR
jgi:hypothetical protein